MCNSSLHPRNFNNLVEPLSFSTFQFLRSRNRLMLSSDGSTGKFWNIVVTQITNERIQMNSADHELSE